MSPGGPRSARDTEARGKARVKRVHGESWKDTKGIGEKDGLSSTWAFLHGSVRFGSPDPDRQISGTGLGTFSPTIYMHNKLF